MSKADHEFDPTPSKCKLARLMDLLTEDQQQKLNVALDKRKPDDHDQYLISAIRIVSSLRDWGYYIGETVVKAHRRKVCACR